MGGPGEFHSTIIFRYFPKNNIGEVFVFEYKQRCIVLLIATNTNITQANK